MMAHIRECALDSRLPPRRILRRHAHDELTDLEQDSSLSGFVGVRPFPSDQLPMPPSNVSGVAIVAISRRVRTAEPKRAGGKPRRRL